MALVDDLRARVEFYLFRANKPYLVRVTKRWQKLSAAILSAVSTYLLRLSPEKDVFVR